MPDPVALRTLAGVSSALGLLACLAYFFVFFKSRGAERSAREAIGDSGLFNSSQLIEILAKFKSDEARLKALLQFTRMERANAEALLSKVKADISVGELRALSHRRDAFMTLVGGIVLLLFGALGLFAARDAPPAGATLGKSDLPNTQVAKLFPFTPVSLLVYDYRNAANLCKGYYLSDGRSNWAEVTSGADGCNSTLFNFREIERTATHAVIYDASRKALLQVPFRDGWVMYQPSKSEPWIAIHETRRLK